MIHTKSRLTDGSSIEVAASTLAKDMASEKIIRAETGIETFVAPSAGSVLETKGENG